MRKLSAWLAIAVGVAVAIAQLYRNWGNWENWLTWTVDEFAAAVLIVAGASALRSPITRLLPVGWAFACGLWSAGAIIHFNGLDNAPADRLDLEQQLVVLLSGLLVVTLIGLALVMFDRRKST